MSFWDMIGLSSEQLDVVGESLGQITEDQYRAIISEPDGARRLAKIKAATDQIALFKNNQELAESVVKGMFNSLDYHNIEFKISKAKAYADRGELIPKEYQVPAALEQAYNKFNTEKAQTEQLNTTFNQYLKSTG